MHATSPFDGLSAGLRLGIGAGEPDADADALSRVEDWSTVVALARRHGVVSLLVKGLRTDAGPDIEPRLIALHRRTVRRGMRQFQGLKQAADTLAAVGVPCLVLKGLPLSQRIYAHPFVRDPNDIDLLVPPAAFRDAERALCGHGWVRVKPNFPATSARMRWYRRFVSQSTLNGPGGGLDLHHRLSHNPRYFDVPFERLYDGGAVTTIGESGFATLGGGPPVRLSDLPRRAFAVAPAEVAERYRRVDRRHGAGSVPTGNCPVSAGRAGNRARRNVAALSGDFPCRAAGRRQGAAGVPRPLRATRLGGRRSRPSLQHPDRESRRSRPQAGCRLRATRNGASRLQVLYDLLRWSLRRTGEQKPRA